MDVKDRTPEYYQRLDEVNRANEELRKRLAALEVLGIPTYGDNVSVFDLYSILMDEEKLSVIVAKLKYKAFW